MWRSVRRMRDSSSADIFTTLECNAQRESLVPPAIQTHTNWCSQNHSRRAKQIFGSNGNGALCSLPYEFVPHGNVFNNLPPPPDDARAAMPAQDGSIAWSRSVLERNKDLYRRGHPMVCRLLPLALCPERVSDRTCVSPFLALVVDCLVWLKFTIDVHEEI
jgi:hypothetical protein